MWDLDLSGTHLTAACAGPIAALIAQAGAERLYLHRNQLTAAAM
eukprot:gene8441-11852_t